MPNLSELLYYTGETSTQLIVWSLFIGVIIATIAGYLIKMKFGTFIRTLLEKEINSPEKAATLEELGLKKSLFIKVGLKSHANYKNMLVAITEDGKFFANNEYTDVEPILKEFIVVKRKRGSDAIKETKSDSEENTPLSGLAKVIQSKERAAALKEADEKTAVTEDTAHENAAEAEAAENNIGVTSPELTTAATDNETDAQLEKICLNTDIPKQRVKFDVSKARYYIPPEIHDRAYSLYHTNSGKANGLIVAIALLILLGLIATFSGELISGFTDFLGGIKNPFSKPII